MSIPVSYSSQVSAYSHTVVVKNIAGVPIYVKIEGKVDAISDNRGNTYRHEGDRYAAYNVSVGPTIITVTGRDIIRIDAESIG